jgi:hypothetical protein
MALDEVLPDYDFRSRHSRTLAAEPEELWWAVERYRLDRDSSFLIRSLFRLRGLSVPRGTLRDALDGSSFTLVAERPGKEIVAATTGRFWTIRERANMEAPDDLDAFLAFDRPGWAKAAVCIRAEPRDHGATDLVTETRVQCVDYGARRRFAVYWMLINVFSGWIRRDMLEGIASLAAHAPQRLRVHGRPLAPGLRRLQ